MLRDFDFESPIIDWLNDYASQGIVTTDTSLIIRGWNRWLEEKTGRGAPSVIGSSLLVVFPELMERRLDRLYREALGGQVTVLSHRFHGYLLKLPVPAEYALREMQQSGLIGPLVRDGRVVGTMTVIDDVSERVIRENELVAAREAADKLNEAKDRFLTLLSHDLRTPLTAIVGWARVFRDRPSDERIVRKGAEVIERNAAVQLELIEQILDISRFAAAKLELNVEPVNVREMILTTLETLEPIAEAKGIKIACVLPDKERSSALDGKRFQQVIWNLISNALKFTPNDGWVRATMKYRDHDFQLMITDSGKGISAESLPHLFEPLWQAQGSSGHGGLGLGLAIAKNLVELHGGSIRAESSGLGHGSTFIVEIPWSGPQDQGGSTLYGNSQIM